LSAPKRIMITGVNGTIGQELARHFSEAGHTVSGIGRAPRPLVDIDQYFPIDITDMPSLDLTFSIAKPQVVIHTAAMSGVEECERLPSMCENVNVNGTANLLVQAEDAQAHFIFLSTDFVFDGKTGMNSESDELSPVNFYGFSKMQAEALVETNDSPWTIVRTSMVVGGRSILKPDLIERVVAHLRAGKTMRVVKDLFRTPTLLMDLCKGIGLIADRQFTGSVHLAGAERLSPYDLAKLAAEATGLDAAALEPVEYVSTQVKRPVNGGLNIRQASETLNFQPTPLLQGIRKMLTT
jgi:dTDP-4-dehydrorhamnose reductase